ncbi:MAG: hypothetical protein HXX09_13215 [Bacteroidetes bacterium]|nr:hypothetical protein [Bacteroidota bacterium]
MKLKTGKGNIIEVDDTPLAKGGQAGIHKTISPTMNPPVVAKIFFDKAFLDKTTGNVDTKKVKYLKDRLEYMVNNNPFINSKQKLQEAFAWPVDLLFDLNNEFKGFLLPFLDQSIDLIKILSGKKLPAQWDKFEIQHPDSYNSRIKVCYNLSQALAEMHSGGTYTIVDLKGENIMLKDNGFISMIDLDSIQISQNNKVLFHAEVHTPDFSPPEFHKNLLNYKTDFVEETWDRFSFAALAYLILFKVHPFSGMTHLTNPSIHSMDDFIVNGLFAHGSQKNSLALAPPHYNYDTLLSDDLKDLFYRCFEDGHQDPKKRPTAVEWRDTFLKEINKNKNTNISAGSNQPASYVPAPQNTFNQIPVNPTNVNPINPIIPNIPIIPVIPNIPIFAPAALPVFINNFMVTPAGPNRVNVIWDVSNATIVEINCMQVAATGNMQFALSNQIFYLEAFDASGQSVTAQTSANLQVNINTFNHQLLLNAIQLTWSVTGAISVVVDNNPVSSNGILNLPLAIGTHSIEATDINGFIVFQQIQVNVLTAINQFDLVINRSDATLTWDVMNAVNLTLNNKAVASSGTITITLDPCFYTLAAIDSAGNVVTKIENLNVSPKIVRFDLVQNKHSVEIFWDIFYARNCSLDGEQIPYFGSKKFPLFPKKFKLEIEDYSGFITDHGKSLNVSPAGSIIPITPLNDVDLIKSDSLALNNCIQDFSNILSLTSISNQLNSSISINQNEIQLAENNKNLINIQAKLLQLKQPVQSNNQKLNSNGNITTITGKIIPLLKRISSKAAMFFALFFGFIFMR